MSGIHWTEQEKNILRDCAAKGIYAAEDIQKQFLPKKSITAIVIQARRNLGLRKISAEGNNYSSWKPEEENILRNCFSNSIFDFERISKEFIPRHPPTSIKRRYLKLKLSVPRIICHRKYVHDDNYFSIPNLHNSYWAGYLCADGTIVSSSAFQLVLAVADIEHLKKFALELKYNGPIHIHNNDGIMIDPRTKVKRYVKSTSAGLRVSGAPKCIADLASNFGVIPNKTYRIQPPNLNSLLLKLAFLRGEIDGDGMIHMLTQRTVKGFYIKICSATYDILKWFKKLVDELDLTVLHDKIYNVNPVYGTKAFVLNFAGIRACKLFLLLNSLDTPFLARKWRQQPIFDYIAVQRLKYPDLFKDVDSLIEKLHAEQQLTKAA